MDKVIKKQKELIAKLNDFCEFLNNANDFNKGEDDWQETHDVKLERIKKLESELTALEKQGEKPVALSGAEEFLTAFLKSHGYWQCEQLNRYNIIEIMEAYARQPVEVSDDRACPCLILDEPCKPNCSCKNPFSSAGCHYCSTYGSIEQRKAMAEFIKSKIDFHLPWIS